MTNNYKTLQALILQSEGKTLEDELVCSQFHDCHCEEEISLARVLRALGKKDYEPEKTYIESRNLAFNFCPEGFCISFSDYYDMYSPEILKDICIWDLDHPLHLQSPKTITKLTELLK